MPYVLMVVDEVSGSRLQKTERLSIIAEPAAICQPVDETDQLT